MISKDDIIARLQDGDSVDAIAAEMTDALNAAKADYEKLQEEARLERAAEEAVTKRKREAVEKILDAYCDYAVAAGDDELLEDLHEADVDKMVKIMDQACSVVKTLNKVKDLEFKAPEVRVDRDLFNMFAGLL